MASTRLAYAYPFDDSHVALLESDPDGNHWHPAVAEPAHGMTAAGDPLLTAAHLAGGTDSPMLAVYGTRAWAGSAHYYEVPFPGHAYPQSKGYAVLWRTTNGTDWRS